MKRLSKPSDVIDIEISEEEIEALCLLLETYTLKDVDHIDRTIDDVLDEINLVLDHNSVEVDAHHLYQNLTDLRGY